MKKKSKRLILVRFILIVIVIILIFSCYCVRELEFGIVWKIIYCSGIVIVIALLLSLLRQYINWVAYGKCDMEAYYALLKITTNRNKTSWNLAMLIACEALEKYDECPDLIEKLDSMKLLLSEKQKIEFQIRKIIYYTQMEEQDKKNEELERLLEDISTMNKDDDNYILAMAQVYWTENDYEKTIEMLNKINNPTVFAEVQKNYRKGICYFKLNRYKEAFSCLNFVCRWGGNTIYVSNAREITEKIPDEIKCLELPEEKPQNYPKGKWRLFIHIIGMLIVFCYMFAGHNYISSGTGIREIYCKQYLCKENDIDILYQGKISDHELVIINKGDRIQYCLYKQDSKNKTYKQIATFSTDKDKSLNDTNEQSDASKEADREFHIEFQYYAEIESLSGFYKRTELSANKNMTMMGISYCSYIEDVTVNEQPVEIIQTTTKDGETFYVWEVNNINLDDLIDVSYQTSRDE